MNITDEFISCYGEGKNPVQVFFAPGRVNLIGEHTDYNGGWVLPMALAYGTTLAVRKRNDRIVRLASLNDPFKTDVDIDSAITPLEKKWVNYPLGIIKEYEDRGLKVDGMDMLFYGDIPKGAGLSSSASIEMVTSFTVNDLNGFGLDIIGQVKLAQHAENHFVGMNCGIMDQFSVGVSSGGFALLLNCDTLEYEKTPVKIKGYTIVIVNTNKERELTGSKYNERRSECERAVDLVNPVFAVKHLGELKVGDLGRIETLINDPLIYRRARHVITEIDRVHQAVESLRNNEVSRLGRLMVQSHDSLRYDYEVSCRELDVLVEISLTSGFAAGARMTGAGFGGCIVSLVKEDKVDDYMAYVRAEYFRQTSKYPDFYFSGSTEGIRRVQ